MLEQENERRLTDRSGILERHAQTILISIITAAILFSANFMYNTNKATGELVVKMEFLSKQVEALQIKLETLNNNYVRKDDFVDLDKRVRVLERQK